MLDVFTSFGLDAFSLPTPSAPHPACRRSAMRRLRRASRAVRPTTVRGHQQSAQAAEAVGVDDAERHQLRQCFFDLCRQESGTFDDLVEERGAAFDERSDFLRFGVSCGVRDAPCGTRPGRTLRRASSAIGVERTGAAPRSASLARVASRVHTMRPARHCSSSQAFRVIPRCVREHFGFLRAWGASKPSSCPSTAGTASALHAGCTGHRCQSNRKRRKSRAGQVRSRPADV